MREALFSILVSRASLADVRALDLYAGTGALGLEALSRGAAHVTFVEKRREALVALRANVEAVGVAALARIVGRAVERAGPDLGRFDIVFADPPYADVQSGAAVRALEQVLVTALAEGGWFVLEHASKTAPPRFVGIFGPDGGPTDTRIYGDTAVSLYRR